MILAGKRRKAVIAVGILFIILIFGTVFGYCYLRNRLFPSIYREQVKKISEKYGLDPLLVAAIVARESNFDARAISAKEARGLMQVLPTTAKEIAERLKCNDYKKSDLFDPEINLEFGCYYFSRLMREFDNDELFALAAYNAGSKNVKKWIGDLTSDSKSIIEKHAFPETKRYVKEVLKIYKIIKILNKIKSF